MHSSHPGQLNPVLAQAVDKVPALARLLDRCGSMTLAEYARALFSYRPDAPQDHADAAREAGAMAAMVLGGNAGETVEHSLRETPVVVTGPHHGFDTMPVTVQGSLVCALGGGGAAQSVCVMGSSNVPLSNYTTPGGLALARDREEGAPGTYARIHFFPAGERARLVHGCPPVTAGMVENAGRRVQALFQAGTLSLAEKRQLDGLLQAVYADPELLAQPNLSRQATLAADRLWDAILPDGTARIRHIDKDEVVCRLLRWDVMDACSLVHRVFFDPRLRQRIMGLLDGAYGCWSARRLEALSENAESDGNVSGPVGTAFFWGVDDRTGARVPLLLEEGEVPLLQSTAGGEPVAFTPQGVFDALERGVLVPGLFTTFLCILFARGVRCVGGQLQAGYLPVMRDALVKTLREAGTARGRGQAELVARMPLHDVLTGLMGVLHGDVGTTGRMAGAVEMYLSGGLSLDTLTRLGGVTVEQALVAGMLEMYPVLFAPSERMDGWERHVRAEMAQRMSDGLAMLA